MLSLLAMALCLYAAFLTVGMLLFGYAATLARKLNPNPGKTRPILIGAAALFAAYSIKRMYDAWSEILFGATETTEFQLVFMLAAALMLIMTYKVVSLACETDSGHYVRGYGKRVIVLE